MNIKITLKIVLLSLFCFLAENKLSAQTNVGTLQGTVNDSKTQKGISGAIIRIFNADDTKFEFSIAEQISDAQGSYMFDQLAPGYYILITDKPDFKSDTTESLSLAISETKLAYIYLKNLIKTDKEPVTTGAGIVVKNVLGTKLQKTQNSTTFDKEILRKSGFRDFNSLAGLGAGITRTAGGLSGRGSRVDGTVYFIDGVRVINPSLAQSSSDQVDILQGGIPAQYGDFTGLGVAISTRGGVNPKPFTALEIQSSSMFNPYHSNLIEFSMGRPILFKENKKYDPNGTGNAKIKNIPIAGMILSANFSFNRDGASYIPYTQINDEKLNKLERNPLIVNKDGGYVHAANYLTEDDYDLVKVRNNRRSYASSASAKFDFRLNDLATLSVFGNFNYSNSLATSGQSSYLMAYRNNPLSTRTDVLGYVKFLQRFKDPDAAKKALGATLNKTAIEVRLDYQSTWAKSQDANFRDDIFSYGYIGQFRHFPTAAYSAAAFSNSTSKGFVDQNGDTVFLKNYYEQVGFRDTSIKFTRANINQVRGNYTQSLFDKTREQGGRITTDDDILRQQGLLNGYNPNSIYSLFNTPGTQLAGFSKSQAERYTLYALGQTVLTGKVTEGKEAGGSHSLQFGILYEQTVSRSYGLNANNLWRLMGQLANSHITELDKPKLGINGEITGNAIVSYDANGVFRDTIRFNRLVNSAAQSTFDKEFRTKLINQGATDIYGKKINQTTFLDINSYKPSDFNINMFSADELLSNGSGAYVSYNGFDYKGKRLRGRPSVNDFINNKLQRSIGAFMPIYTAAWFQDKFMFKDLEFRLGLRLERYDANQIVLKDPYSIYPVKTAGEVDKLGGNPVTHPSNIGSDYAVYVDDNKSINPKIVGYRKDNQWYSESGILTTGDFIAAKSGGSVKPLLVDKNQSEITEASFKDYQPKVNVLPRIFFKFPLNPTSLFFASYDVLAQRPNANQITIDDYFFINGKSSPTVANPALTSRITTAYEIGFKQQLNKSTLLSLMTYYKETKNDVNEFFLSHTSPVQNYISYSNIDFSTVKGFTAEFDYKAKNNITLNANYTLQFADGTGASIGSNRALISSNQPNLRSLFPLGDLDIRHQLKGYINWEFFGDQGVGKDKAKYKYTGPLIGGKKIFANTNFTITYAAVSGLPYTAKLQPIQQGAVDVSPIKGTPFGSRLPWQFNMSLNVSKDIAIKLTNKEGTKDRNLNLQVYYFVTNLLNTQNVNSVWPYTGSVKDDGFLNSPKGQQALQTQLSADAYRFYYNTAVNNPGFYQGPRFMRLGAKLFF